MYPFPVKRTHARPELDTGSIQDETCRTLLQEASGEKEQGPSDTRKCSQDTEKVWC